MKNMKKKVVIVAAMVLLLATVLVMSMSTFAKYTSTATPVSANATVAQWGLVANANAANLFPAKYGPAASNLADAWVDADAAKVSVADSGTAATVAPGTTGSVSFGVSGTAEVLAKVTITATGTDLVLTKGSETYSPIKWSLSKNGVAVAEYQNKTLAEIVTYLNTDAIDETIQPNSTVAAEYVLTWTWAFNNTDASGIAGLDGNAADTILGKLAVGAVEGYSKTDVSFGVTVAVEQIQAQ